MISFCFHFLLEGNSVGEWRVCQQSGQSAVSSQKVKDVPYLSGHYQVSLSDGHRQRIEKGTVGKRL